MRILIVGAGALGGYFGARLLQAGRDVTFLVRPRRAAQLAKTGLVVRSTHGDAQIESPPLVLAENITAPFDLILVGCKAYDLAPTMESFARAVGPETALLPYLNGMKHFESLSERFGAQRVLGGLAMISATLDDDGIVMHLNETHVLTYGELDGAQSPRVAEISAAFAGANFDPRTTNTIVQELWEKWVFIATLGGITSLMRGVVGDIERAGAAGLALALLDECSAIAASQGLVPPAHLLERGRRLFTAPGSTLTASMMKDIERGARTEADHIIGDLLARGGSSAVETPLLRIVSAHLGTYEARRAREMKSTASNP
ncbi:MAG: ketopantoate reductase family protein [Gemmatimonadales bacterium]